MKYQLNELNINTVSKETDAYLVKRKTAPKDRTHTKLSIEEVLLDYMGVFGRDGEFSVDYGGGLFKNRIRLSVPGKPVDPFDIHATDSEDDQLLSNVLSRMGQRPKWQYARGVNTIIYTPAKKSAPNWVKLLTAIMAAIVLGLAVRALPANVSAAIREDVVSPLLNTFLGFLNAVAGPMIFLSIIWGIYSIGDISIFSEIGRRLCVRFLLTLCILTTLTALISVPFFSFHYGNVQNGNPFSALYQMLLDIIPDNLFTPFTNSNTLQIMFVGIVVGVMMLKLGKNMQAVADLTEQLGLIVDGIMGVISRLVPVFVFGSLFNIIASSNLSSLGTGGKFIAGTLMNCILLILIHTALACMKMRMAPLDLWKRTFSTFLIAITTASSSAAFADNKKTCIEKLGISERLANFGVPFGQLLYKPAMAGLFWFAVISVAENSQMEVSAVWLITSAVIIIIMSAAAPPVPGGPTASFTILFSQLALPVTNLAVILTLTSILDFVTTASNVFARQCVLAISYNRVEKKAIVNDE